MLNIYIKQSGKSGGPSVFRNRLISALSAYDGVNIVKGINGKFEVELAFIHSEIEHDKPIILRLDGCYYMQHQTGMNKSIIRAMKKSAGVIFQSDYSKWLCDSILGSRQKITTVIHNGLDLEYVNRIEPNPQIHPGSFVACADWRHNKRPMSTINGFLEANTGKHLYMIGDGISKVKHDKVHLIGRQSTGSIIAIMKACQYMMHLCHIDSCPNSVIEGLACGLNVLCTNLGGTKELVQDDGVVLECDEVVEKSIPKRNMDDLKPSLVADGIRLLMNKSERANRPDLDIKLVCEKYIDFIRSVVR